MKRSLIFFLMIMSAFTGSVFAQGKVDGNTLRLKGALFLGSLRPDFEKRNFYSDIVGLEYNQDWQNNRGMTFINDLGFDYFHSLNAGILSNVFLGLHLNRFGRGYEWNSYYANGLGIKDADYRLLYSDINIGFTLSPVSNFRILPKYVLRSVGQSLEGSYLGVGAPVYLGQDTKTATGTSGLLGVGFEFDLNERATLFADFLIYGPFLLNSTGTYNSEHFRIYNNGIVYNYASGGYTFYSEKISVGGSIVVVPRLRLFASFESERMTAKSQSPIAFSVSENGISSLGTLMEFVSATAEHNILVSGLKFGVTYDLNL
ncbi:hypothetical protein [Leptospira meyeri]|uniref:hypothetical protein n=1 Tax=Leptospira meyeri TaxID=29508 RepID=UPI000C2B384D|nr:hypothetical protein [Leptospira meyeri]PKA27522.1 hypothetical protein CH381_04695 [Leptospira sp. mixed culture ATI2-C-A1]MCW7489285.1 hypothetical protein [Leptospira meyeri]PJZ82059.1 hypothetical protein CH359_03700 [Leptospira meyeri]PJZ97564.1 hypothetical protein CH358_00740 [Leptospira meyeri]PKA12342.1 hypothetical protein CH372_09615 [Leptospira meyeri]